MGDLLGSFPEACGAKTSLHGSKVSSPASSVVFLFRIIRVYKYNVEESRIVILFLATQSFIITAYLNIHIHSLFRDIYLFCIFERCVNSSGSDKIDYFHQCDT